MSKGENTRNRIVETAAALFNKKGFNGCSMQDISLATGLEKASLYGHFPTKEQLALAAFDYAWGQSGSARVANLDQVPGSIDKLKLHIENFVSILPFPGGCPLLNTAIDSDDGSAALRRRARAALNGWTGCLKELIEVGQTNGEISDSVDPEALATLIVCLLEGAFFAAKLRRSKRPLLIAQRHLNSHLDLHVRSQRFN